MKRIWLAAVAGVLVLAVAVGVVAACLWYDSAEPAGSCTHCLYDRVGPGAVCHIVHAAFL